MKSVILDEETKIYKCPDCLCKYFAIVDGKAADLSPEKQAVCTNCGNRCLI